MQDWEFVVALAYFGASVVVVVVVEAAGCCIVGYHTGRGIGVAQIEVVALASHPLPGKVQTAVSVQQALVERVLCVVLPLPMRASGLGGGRFVAAPLLDVPWQPHRVCVVARLVVLQVGLAPSVRPFLAQQVGGLLPVDAVLLLEVVNVAPLLAGASSVHVPAAPATSSFARVVFFQAWPAPHVAAPTLLAAQLGPLLTAHPPTLFALASL